MFVTAPHGCVQRYKPVEGAKAIIWKMLQRSSRQKLTAPELLQLMASGVTFTDGRRTRSGNVKGNGNHQSGWPFIFRSSVQCFPAIKLLKLDCRKSYPELWDGLADLVGGGTRAGTVIGPDDEIVRSANGQIAYGGGCDGAQRNGSCIGTR